MVYFAIEPYAVFTDTPTLSSVYGNFFQEDF